MLNAVHLIGRLVADPELKSTATGDSCCQVRLAVERNFKNKAGKRDADFINVVFWRKTAENVAKYLRKGGMMAVSGTLQSRAFDDAGGNKRVYIEVVGEVVQFIQTSSDGTAKASDEAPAELPGGEDIPF